MAESVLTSAWLDEEPFAASHRGDLEWWVASVAPHPLGEHLRLWSVDDTVRGWSWIQGHVVHWEIGPGDPSMSGQILEAILRAAIDDTTGRLEAWAPEDDTASSMLLRSFGFLPDELRLSQFQRRVDRDAPIADATAPAGYRLRHVEGPDEIPARVEIHRLAFPTSDLTVEKYTRLTTLPAYRYDDDLVVEAADGSLAAFAMAWWDPLARMGEFEPVGTHPEHRRRGLGRALIGAGLRRYRDLGAGLVQVYAMADNPAAEALYQDGGFVRRRYRRRFILPANSADRVRASLDPSVSRTSPG
ncbi:MAG: GNAT family N-acetyltransferase [Candidatus Limnocylindria bacterium]